MLMAHRVVVCACAVIAVTAPTLAFAAVTGLTNLGNPSGSGSNLFATHAQGLPARLYVTGRTGTIWILNLPTNTRRTTPYLTIPGVAATGEGGLLGYAFHPDYATNGKSYAYYTTTGGSFGVLQSNIVEFTRSSSNPDTAPASSARSLLTWSQPQDNHNGGWIGFSPIDGYLYIASGDGGNGNDTGTGHTAGTGNAQDITGNLLGKMLRIDVNTDDFPTDSARNYGIPATNPFAGAVTGDDEIWSYGLRNPYRDSFDRQTGELWIADVGQGDREEVNREPAGAAGRNYGWRLREGSIPTPASGIGGPAPVGAIDPTYEYSHGSGALQGDSITGGYIYRGPDPTLQGWYYFADFVDSNYWRFNPSDPAGTVQNLNTLFGGASRPFNPVSFAEDAAGNLYVLAGNGNMFRMNTNALIGGDYNGDGVVNQGDYDRWAAAYGMTGTNAADGNADGVVDAADYTVWRDNLGATAQGAPPTGPALSTPEPGAAVLLAFGAASLSRRSRVGGARK
ncbi:MAG: PQQ-dependent sugar dehydrogenase [Lacipirellulaceae bacterium]